MGFKNPDRFVVIMLRDAASVERFATALGEGVEVQQRWGRGQVSRERAEPCAATHYVAEVEVPTTEAVLEMLERDPQRVQEAEQTPDGFVVSMVVG